VNHSVQYGIAAVASWSEHALTLYLIPGIKDCRFITLLGLAICIGILSTFQIWC